MNTTQTVLVISNHDFSFEEIASLNRLGKISTVAGSVAVLHTNSVNLPEVKNLAFVLSTEDPHPLTASLDVSVQDTGAEYVWQLKDRNDHNVTGIGVIIGFVDTGIDLTHPDFRFPNGTTKILYVWDQTVSGHPPSGFDYGYECSSFDIQTDKCPEVDTFGHGTHVAGIAASSGMASGNYTGVAPGASIIFVKSGDQICNGSSWTFDDAHILDGINYIVQKAHLLGRRAVINLSLGGNIGGHDGTDPLEIGLDSFVNDGTPIVVAAGNEAKDNTHVHGQISTQNSVFVNIEVKPSTTDLQIDIWYATRDEIYTTLTLPDGSNYSTQNPSYAASKFGNITATSTSTPHGEEAYFEVNSRNSLPLTGWKIGLTTLRPLVNETWDSWVDGTSCSYPPAFFLPGTGYDIDLHDTIGIPGTAHNVITVGAYITKTKWMGSNGKHYGSTDLTVGQLALFSSLGPTRDDRTKPDIVAPGMFIASARSSLVPLSDSDPDKYHRILAGTSMAAPHVAGIVALILQYAPSLSALQITNIIRRSGREDAFTGLIPTDGSPGWGFGKADARTSTGFFRLTFLSMGLPSYAIVQLNVDNNAKWFQANMWFDEYFLKNTTHYVSISGEMRERVNVRYIYLGHNFTAFESSIEILKYNTQYYLDAIGDERIDAGWFEAASVIQLQAPPALTANAPLDWVGARFTRIGWWTGDHAIVQSGIIYLDQPMVVMALYILTYPPEVTEALSSVCLATLLVLAYRRLTSSLEKHPSLESEHQARRDPSSGED
jgi:subtilisin family serine protease